MDFLCGPVVKTLSSNAGGVGSIPGQGTNIPHVVVQFLSRVRLCDPTDCSMQDPTCLAAKKNKT